MKWIGVLIAGLVVIFSIAAGVLSIMGGLDNQGESVASTEIEAPLEMIFEWTTEPSQTPRWIRRLKTSSKITKGDLKKEAIVREMITTPDGTYEITGTFLEFEPQKRFSVEYIVTGWTPTGGKLAAKKQGDEPVNRVLSTMTFDPLDENRVRLTYVVKTDYNFWYMRLFEPLATYGGTRSMESNLEDLKSRVEAEHKRVVARNKKAKERKKKKALEKKNKKTKKNKKPKTTPPTNLDINRDNLFKAMHPAGFKPILPKPKPSKKP